MIVCFSLHAVPAEASVMSGPITAEIHGMMQIRDLPANPGMCYDLWRMYFLRASHLLICSRPLSVRHCVHLTTCRLYRAVLVADILPQSPAAQCLCLNSFSAAIAYDHSSSRAPSAILHLSCSPSPSSSSFSDPTFPEGPGHLASLLSASLFISLQTSSGSNSTNGFSATVRLGPSS